MAQLRLVPEARRKNPREPPALSNSAPVSIRWQPARSSWTRPAPPATGPALDNSPASTRLPPYPTGVCIPPGRLWNCCCRISARPRLQFESSIKRAEVSAQANERLKPLGILVVGGQLQRRIELRQKFG